MVLGESLHGGNASPILNMKKSTLKAVKLTKSLQISSERVRQYHYAIHYDGDVTVIQYPWGIGSRTSLKVPSFTHAQALRTKWCSVCM